MSVSIARAYRPVEVDLWGAAYETVDVTRSGARKVAEIEKQMGELEEGQSDEMIGLMAEMLDVKLANANGSKKKASTHIKAKWQADELSLDQLFSFLGQIAEAEQDRPT